MNEHTVWVDEEESTYEGGNFFFHWRLFVRVDSVEWTRDGTR